MFKRVEYQDEHELRLIVIRPDENEAHLATEDEKLIKPEHDGINLPIDLATLLSRVIVGPGTPNATIEGIKQKIANHGIGIPVCKSVLDAVPLF